jgi:serpin B
MRKAVISLVVGALLTACGSAVQSPGSGSSPTPSQAALVPLDALAKAVARDDNQFGWSLFARLASERSGNLLVSPYSIATALQMALQGARGQTATEMLKVLQLSSAPDAAHALAALNRSLAAANVKDGLTIRIADALWLQHGLPLQPAFQSTIQNAYAAALHDVDFIGDPEKARTTINDAVAHQTNNRIRDLIPPGQIDTMTRLVLTNAIYLKALWESPFPKTATKPGVFHLTGGNDASVPFMHLADHFLYAKRPGYQEVQLPFIGGRLAMHLFLPDNSVDALPPALMRDPTRASSMDIAGVDLVLPKFRFTSQFSLGDTLSAMGMPTAFDPNAADFSGMTTEPLYIKAALHKSFINVDERGTEAAGATALIAEGTAAIVVNRHAHLVFNKPFLFTINDETTGAVLFMGRVNDPRS